MCIKQTAENILSSIMYSRAHNLKQLRHWEIVYKSAETEALSKNAAVNVAMYRHAFLELEAILREHEVEIV